MKKILLKKLEKISAGFPVIAFASLKTFNAKRIARLTVGAGEGGSIPPPFVPSAPPIVIPAPPLPVFASPNKTNQRTRGILLD